MGVRIANLRCKEVVSICDGQRLGFVADVEIKLPEGQVCSLIVPAPCKLGSALGRREDYVIPWSCIRRIGEDIILVEIQADQCRCPKPKGKWL